MVCKIIFIKAHLLTLSYSKIIVLSVNNQTYVTFSQRKGLKPIIILSYRPQGCSPCSGFSSPPPRSKNFCTKKTERRGLSCFARPKRHSAFWLLNLTGSAKICFSLGSLALEPPTRLFALFGVLIPPPTIQKFLHKKTERRGFEPLVELLPHNLSKIAP